MFITLKLKFQWIQCKQHLKTLINLVEFDELILKYIWDCKYPNTEEEQGSRRHIQTSYKDLLISTLWYSQEGRHLDQIRYKAQKQTIHLWISDK